MSSSSPTSISPVYTAVSVSDFNSSEDSASDDRFDVEASLPLIEQNDGIEEPSQEGNEERSFPFCRTLIVILCGWILGALLLLVSMCSSAILALRWHDVAPAPSDDLSSFFMFYLCGAIRNAHVLACLAIWLYVGPCFFTAVSVAKFRTAMHFLMAFVVGWSSATMTLNYFTGFSETIPKHAAILTTSLLFNFFSLRCFVGSSTGDNKTVDDIEEQ